MKNLLGVAVAASQLLLAGVALAHSGHGGWVGHMHGLDYAAITIGVIAALVVVRRLRHLPRRNR